LTIKNGHVSPSAFATLPDRLSKSFGSVLDP
jgi:hypothetical protein